jgi:subtilisin-like proprotein convertase family protein
MRPRFRSYPVAVFFFGALASAASALSPAEAPRATPRLLRELDRGAASVPVLVGVVDGTPTARQLAANPDPAGEPARRVRRIEAQQRLVDSLPAEQFTPRHYYESFSIVAGTASREGALALARRTDVAWVALDGVKRPTQGTPQNAQVLIGSDQVNTLGYTGSGSAVAVLDTGVDYTVSTLGGAPFPNGKVIGGTDVADHDSDPMDCEGHGTEVASVISGPLGVAPGVKIVAVKVFASQTATNATCKDTANDSDILQGVNYAITNRTTFSSPIVAINLSLGGEWDDNQPHGYCDADEPGYSTAFDSANAAGIVVVVSAGNGGATNAISAPACVASAVSVGAVYAEVHSRVAWSDGNGGIQCTDAPTAADQIICFSDSNTNLSLYAPGAFWQVTNKGGSGDVFHGTSASAPAVSGAVALLHQARPDLTPSGIVGLLRATGKPILDARNSVTTPRVDTLAAVQLAVGRFSAYTGGAVAIPDGGTATATLTVSGFLQSLASVQVWVEIDHPDPSQLVVTLIGPDGTQVVLQNQTGSLQHPINAIYGKTDASAESLAAFAGKAANGVWTLKVEDKVLGTTGRIKNFALALLPGQPTAAIPPGAAASSRVLPVVAHVQGTKLFLSDVRLFNPGPSIETFSLYYVPAGRNGASALRLTQAVNPGVVLALNDIIQSQYGLADSIGQITIVASPDAPFFASSRAYSQSANGNFGLHIPAFRNPTGIALGSGTATANGLQKNSQFHTNVGFTEVSGAPVTVDIDLFDGNGALLASTTRSTDPFTTFLITDVINDRGLPATSNFRATFHVTSPTGRVVPFATYVDDVTGDGSFQTAVSPQPTADDVIVPQTAHVTGANGDFFRTNLDVTNLGATPVTITVSLLPLQLTGSPAAPRVYTLAPGQTLEKLDILQSEFGLGDPSSAGLRIHPDVPASLAVSTRTYVSKFGGTFGFSVPGVPASSAFGVGPTATVIQLDQITSSTTGYRSNFGFTEVAGAGANVLVTVRSGDTGATLGSKTYFVAANSSLQGNVTDILGAGAVASNIYVQFQVQSGAGRIVAYGASVDNPSGDGIFMIAE